MMFKKYTPDDFDKHGYLKPPVGFYLILVLLLRAYVVWVLTVANRSGDGTSLVAALYPNKYDFFIGLGAGVGALLVLVLMSLRREKASQWTARLWHKGRWFLWASWSFDVSLTLWVIKQNKFAFEAQYALVLVGLFFCAWYLLKSSRLKDTFANWPSETYLSEQPQDKETKSQS